MKVNQLGTFAMIGVVISFTAACSGSPTAPSVVLPSLGEAVSATSVNLTAFQQEVAAGQICDARSVSLDADGNETGEMSTSDAPSAMCDSSGATDQPQGDAVVSDAPSIDSARFSKLYR